MQGNAERDRNWKTARRRNSYGCSHISRSELTIKSNYFHLPEILNANTSSWRTATWAQVTKPNCALFSKCKPALIRLTPWKKKEGESTGVATGTCCCTLSFPWSPTCATFQLCVAAESFCMELDTFSRFSALLCRLLCVWAATATSCWLQKMPHLSRRNSLKKKVLE